uniref:ATP synthase F0 subunit 8 n=1 Tax=Geukensia demissa TaxID=27807 RepID=A0A6B9VND8_GEUDE|nr:ATP synthase F0 subunit 8 [Geukensia demissa]
MALFGTYLSFFMSFLFMLVFSFLGVILWWSKRIKLKFPKLRLVTYKKIERVKSEVFNSVKPKAKSKKLKS